MEEQNKNNITISLEEYTKIIKENEKYRTDLEHFSKREQQGGGVIIQEHVSPEVKKKKGLF